MDKEKIKHIHNIFEILEYIYSLCIGCTISEHILLIHNIYYKLFICKNNNINYEKLLHMKKMINIAKIEIQPMILLFLHEKNLIEQINIWDISIEWVNNISTELLKKKILNYDRMDLKIKKRFKNMN